MAIQIGRVNPRIDRFINLWKITDSSVPSNSLKSLDIGTIVRVLDDNVVGASYPTNPGNSTKWLKVETFDDSLQGYVGAFFVITGNLGIQMDIKNSPPTLKLGLLNRSNLSEVLEKINTIHTLELVKKEVDNFAAQEFDDDFFPKYYRYLNGEEIDFILIE
jgi:hypothetical protein